MNKPLKLSLAVPRDNLRLVADLIHLNGYKFEVEMTDGPAIIRIHLNDAPATAKFDPRETIKPVASC